MSGARNYGVDSSTSGNVAWCDTCGWRSDIEDDEAHAYDLIVHHRLVEHHQSPGLIRRRLGVAA